MEVKFKPLRGTNDQAAGLVSRMVDADNYYVVRANAMEDNVVLYKVEQGNRKALDIVGRDGGYGVKAKVPGACCAGTFALTPVTAVPPNDVERLAVALLDLVEHDVVFHRISAHHVVVVRVTIAPNQPAAWSLVPLRGLNFTSTNPSLSDASVLTQRGKLGFGVQADCLRTKGRLGAESSFSTDHFGSPVPVILATQPGGIVPTVALSKLAVAALTGSAKPAASARARKALRQAVRMS